MKRLGIGAIIIIMLMTCGTALAADRQAVRLVVPPLVVGQREPASFVVRGSMIPTPGMGLGYYVATDGQRQITVIYDLHDSTPLALSDGQTTFVYDVIDSKILRLEQSQAIVALDWDPDRKKPLSFSVGIHYKITGEDASTARSSFRIDRFAADPDVRLERTTAKDGEETFSARRGKSTDSITTVLADPAWFRFTHVSDTGIWAMQAAYIGQPLPNSAADFPHLKTTKDLRIVDMDKRIMPAAATMLLEGTNWMLPRLALAGDDQMLRQAAESFPDVDWAELKRRDAVLSEAFRKALHEAGLPTERYAPAPATSRPSHP